MDERIPHNIIAEMTGYDQGNKQCEWLEKHGVFFMKDRSGYPHTTWYNFNHPGHLRFNDSQAHTNGPDFESLIKNNR